MQLHSIKTNSKKHRFKEMAIATGISLTAVLGGCTPTTESAKAPTPVPTETQSPTPEVCNNKPSLKDAVEKCLGELMLNDKKGIEVKVLDNSKDGEIILELTPDGHFLSAISEFVEGESEKSKKIILAKFIMGFLNDTFLPEIEGYTKSNLKVAPGIEATTNSPFSFVVKIRDTRKLDKKVPTIKDINTTIV